MTLKEKTDYQRGYDAAMTNKGWMKSDSNDFMEGWFQAMEDRIEIIKQVGMICVHSGISRQSSENLIS